MPDEQTVFSLHYLGETRPAAIDAHELIRLLSAFTNLSTKASRTFYGSEIHTSFRIAHVQPGTIDIQGVLELIAGLQPGFALLPSLSLGVKDIPHLLKLWL